MCYNSPLLKVGSLLSRVKRELKCGSSRGGTRIDNFRVSIPSFTFAVNTALGFLFKVTVSDPNPHLCLFLFFF